MPEHPQAHWNKGHREYGGNARAHRTADCLAPVGSGYDDKSEEQSRDGEHLAKAVFNVEVEHCGDDHHGNATAKGKPESGSNLAQEACEEQSREGYHGGEDGGTGVCVIVELGEEVAGHVGCPCLAVEVCGYIVTRHKEQLVLLLVIERILIGKLEECPNGYGKYGHRYVWYNYLRFHLLKVIVGCKSNKNIRNKTLNRMKFCFFAVILSKKCNLFWLLGQNSVTLQSKVTTLYI